MTHYHILMHPEAYKKAEDYRIELASTPLSLAGSYLHRELQGKDISSINTEIFIEHLVATKPPLVFAESSVYGDGKDWNPTELSILGDFGVATRVQVYDDGKHYETGIHEPPFATAEKLASALKVPVAYFYCDDDRLADFLICYAAFDKSQKDQLLAIVSNLDA
jgi:hypothetical protein